VDCSGRDKLQQGGTADLRYPSSLKKGYHFLNENGNKDLLIAWRAADKTPSLSGDVHYLVSCGRVRSNDGR
jgi:hypothetical protein